MLMCVWFKPRLDELATSKFTLASRLLSILNVLYPKPYISISISTSQFAAISIFQFY